MKNHYSKTAMMVAVVRAGHTILEKGEIYRDNFSSYFVDFPYSIIIRSKILFRLVRNIFLKKVSTVPTQNLYRARFVEDFFILHKNKFETFINFSAGFDCLLLKYSSIFPEFKFIEIDHPLTQEHKLKIIKENPLTFSSFKNLEFISIDYENESIENKVFNKFKNASKPVLGIWMGTTYYISKKTIYEFLEIFSKNTPKGSKLIFDYGIVDSELNIQDQQIFQDLKEYVAKKGEPMISFFSKLEISEFSAKFQFKINQNLSLQELNYHFPRKEYYPISGFSKILVLEVV